MVTDYCYYGVIMCHNHCMHETTCTQADCWFICLRAPEQDDRPTFSNIFDLLNGSDIELLRWSDTDCAQLSNLAMELGAPLSEARTMFLELQEMNLVREDSHSGFLGTDV